MPLQRRLLCLAFALALGHIAADDTNEKTAEAVVKAVVQAETKPKPKAETAHEKKEQQTSEAAGAVAKATTEVLTTEAHAEEVVDQSVIQTASENAKETFKELSDDGVAPKAAADAAAKVAVETVDGASDLSLPNSAKVNAEKAAIAAGAAVADSPDNQGSALTEALVTVKNEINTPGKALQKDKPTGIVQKAKDAVSDLPKAAEETAKEVEDEVGANLSFVWLLLPCIAAVVIGVKKFELLGVDVSYLDRLKQIRSEFDNGGCGAGDERSDLEGRLTDYNELQGMR